MEVVLLSIRKPPNDKLIHKLGRLHKTLRKLYVSTLLERNKLREIREYRVCSRNSGRGQWTSEVVPAFTGWDLLVTL
jgi:hypothetical protein